MFQFHSSNHPLNTICICSKVELNSRGERSPRPGLPLSLTLSGGLSVGPGQGDDTFVHLDAHHHVPLLDELGEQLAVVCLLVQGLMEEDDPADAWLYAVGREEELAVKTAVLLSVLSVDALEALGHAAYRWVGMGLNNNIYKCKIFIYSDPFPFSTFWYVTAFF